MKRYMVLAALAIVPLACAQPLKLTVFDRLKDKASDSTEVTLPKDLIEMAKKFLNLDKDGDGAKVKKLLDGLNGIIVRSLEFDKEGVYTNIDMQQLISELGAPGWNLIVRAEEKHGKGLETSRIWIKTAGNAELGGLRILTAEPKELTVVVIDGNIRPEDLKDLGGLAGLGIPDLNIGNQHKGESPKKEDDI